MNTDTFLGLSGTAAFFLLFVCTVFAIATIMMPLVVIFIHGKTYKIEKTLAAMEDMMRNGR
jgi:maltodextrin utilization protein YvdJ